MSETQERITGGLDRGMLAGLLEALANKHSELDLNFQKVSVTLPNVRMSVELNGTITVSVHMRDMTEEETKALSAKRVEMLSTA
jgi:hypothetical protein